MLEILIMVLMAIAIEAARRYFIVYRYCKIEFRRAYIVPAILIVASMVVPYWVREYFSFLFAIMFSLIDYVVVLVTNDDQDCQRGREKGIKEKELSAEEKKREEKRDKIFFLAYLVSVFVSLAVSIRVDFVDSKTFEQQWQQTETQTILAEPVRTIIDGDEKVAFETESGDLVIVINDDKIDLLKMREGDKLRYLKINRKERFEIVTLRGEAYHK